MGLHRDIAEQPDRLRNLLEAQRATVETIAASVRATDVKFVFLAARGTSDNAGRYANYLWGAINRLPMALATPSLFTYYRRPPRLREALVVGISQSGQSPDVVSVLSEARRQGCLTLAITNTLGSPLASAADYCLAIKAGKERSVAATKTYTAELMAIAMIAAAIRGEGDLWQELQRVPTWVERSLEQDERLAEVCQRYRYVQHCVVLGRGFNYSTAFEWSLKMKELAYIEAEPYSSADFQHGPIAIVERGFPVMAVVPEGRVFQPMTSLLRRLKSQYKAELVVISNSRKALSLAQAPIGLPAGLPEWLSPIVSIVPAQLFSYHLALARGYDPDKPRTLHKVTATR
jgi:glucosamine--fructose-6-phosphate aminotransferase (isomerizing)